jgi:CDP-glucose 4,6-dehydratase
MAALNEPSVSMGDALRSFAGKRVFVTGHTGFKGSWLAFILSELGAEVMGYALAPGTSPSHFELLSLERRVRHVIGDTRDFAVLRRQLTSFEPEYVLHLAAQSLVRRSYEDPIETLQTNVLGSANLLEAIKGCASVRSLVYVTSDKCYENVEWVWGYRETDRLGGHDPYSASKAAAEIVFSAFARSYFAARKDLGAASARAGNVIAGGDWAPDRVVPDCVRALQAGAAVRIRNPGATRPWQHVLEPLSGYLLLAAALHKQPVRYGGAWNFGPSTQEVRTVHDVASSIVQHFGRGSIESVPTADGRHEAGYLQLNCDKAYQLLGWQPRWGVGKALQATAEWYGAVLNGADAERITRAQVREYFTELP